MSIIRVFPSRCAATPDDPAAIVHDENYQFEAIKVASLEPTEIHISVSFTWDLPKVDKLEAFWRRIAPVKVGGPATGQRGEQFTPGMYLKKGYTITSRGCPNNCWFCFVPKRDGSIRELEIKPGYNVQDDNLLACSDKHIRKVFAMCRKQKRGIQFAGGLEAARLKDWHVDELTRLNLQLMYFAYDTPEDLEPLQVAGKKLAEAGIIRPGKNIARCYVLAGWPKDNFAKADQRMFEVMKAGFTPYVMLYRGAKDGKIRSGSWHKFKKRWHGPFVIMSSILEQHRAHYWGGELESYTRRKRSERITD